MVLFSCTVLVRSKKQSLARFELQTLGYQTFGYDHLYWAMMQTPVLFLKDILLRPDTGMTGSKNGMVKDQTGKPFGKESFFQKAKFASTDASRNRTAWPSAPNERCRFLPLFDARIYFFVFFLLFVFEY